MKILILHYHLDCGGVTSVVLNTLSAINQHIQDKIDKIDIVVGKPLELETQEKIKNINPEIEIHHSQDFDYYTNPNFDDIKEKYQSTKDFLEKLIDEDTIIHAHNLNLGKNPIITAVIHDLAEQGVKIVSQIHDFAEENRSANYDLLREIIQEKLGYDLNQTLYPLYPKFVYTAINTRDKKVLTEAGVPEEKVFLLPNAINMQEFGAQEHEKDKVRQELGFADNLPIILYPVRIIRRKNVGEYILISSLFKDMAHFLVSRGSLNPVERPFYNKWKDFCAKHKSNIMFDAGKKVSNFLALLATADIVLSTSVAEGFGLFFLEAWLEDTPVCGRVIPGVTSSFTDAGMKFKFLYENFWIPTSLIDDVDGLVEKYVCSIKKIYNSYGRDLPDDIERLVYESKIKNDKVDFADLDMELQQEIIEKVCADAGVREHILDHNPFLRDLLKQFDEDAIKKNREIIEDVYSMERYAERLGQIYEVLETVGAGLDTTVGNGHARSEGSNVSNGVLDAFLDVEKFRLIL